MPKVPELINLQYLKENVKDEVDFLHADKQQRFHNRNTRTRCEICSELTIKTLEQCQWHHSGVFIVTSERISHLVVMFLLLT